MWIDTDGRRAAFAVASAGGHLDELYALITRFVSADHNVVWVTAETPQTRSLLADERVEWVRDVGARQGVQAARSIPGAISLMRRYRPSIVVSTGAALSFPYLLAARLYGVETHFIESATRLDGPSLTGKLAQAVPGLTLHHQGDWSGGRWQKTESVFESFVRLDRPAGSVSRILVTLGSERFPFPRAVEVVASSLSPDVDVVWQLGHTPSPAGLQGRVHQWLPFDEMTELAEEADVVITHCGVGSVLLALRSGKCPVVLARQARHKEHVDEHQTQLASALKGVGIVHVADTDADDLTELLNQAARTCAVPSAG